MGHMAKTTNGKTAKAGAVNLYLSVETRDTGKKIAAERYGCSLSELVEKLLLKEATAESRRKAA